jgi:hypothetical protein
MRHALDLELASDQRIDQASRRLGDEIRGVGFERLAR